MGLPFGSYINITLRLAASWWSVAIQYGMRVHTCRSTTRLHQSVHAPSHGKQTDTHDGAFPVSGQPVVQVCA